MPLSNPIFRRISRLADEQGVQAFVVGGYVRDHYLRRPSTDIDVVVVGSGIALAEALARELKAKVSVFKTFGTAMVRARNVEVEFVGARRESYTRDSRKPEVEPGTLADDQRRRDFTINAMAWSLNGATFGELVDPFDGMSDLEECIIRTPCDPDVTFSDDPLRMMRAVRFASQLGFTIEEETFEAIRRNAERIRIVSRERIVTELNKIVLSPVPSMGFELLELTGLLERIFPEMHNLKGVEKRGRHAHKDNFLHTLKVVDNVARRSGDLWLRWAAVLHDIAKPLTKAYDPRVGWTFHGHEVLGSKMVPAIFRQLKLPLNEHMKFVQKLVFLHLRQSETLPFEFRAGAPQDEGPGGARPHPQLPASDHGRADHGDLRHRPGARDRRHEGDHQERHPGRRDSQRIRRGLRADGAAGRRAGADPRPEIRRTPRGSVFVGKEKCRKE